MSISTQPINTTLVNSKQEPLPLPPTLDGWPVVGVLPSLVRDPFGSALRAWRQQGDIFVLNLGSTRLVLLSHPRQAQYLLRDNAQNYRKGGALWDSLRGVLGNGLVVSEGDFWLRQRRLMQPQFHRQRLAELMSLMVEAIDEALATWEIPATTGQPLELNGAFNALTMGVVLKTLFGSALDPQALVEVGEDMAYVLGYILVETATNALPRWLPLPGRRRLRQALARFDKAVYAVIRNSRQGRGPENHLLSMLLNTVDEETGAAMDDRQLRDEIATLFLAGFETTAIALTWAVHLLTLHPLAMEKVQAEVDRELAGRTPTLADLPNLKYTRMVLQEAMRVRPPLFWVPRTAVADDEIDGYRIPAGSMVAAFVYGLHRHPEFWPDAERFDPERFAPENAAGRHHFAWIPFGAGQRQCIGRDFAMMEGQLALAMLVQRYHVSARTRELKQPTLSGTLRPKGGVTVNLSRRTTG